MRNLRGWTGGSLLLSLAFAPHAQGGAGAASASPSKAAEIAACFEYASRMSVTADKESAVGICFEKWKSSMSFDDCLRRAPTADSRFDCFDESRDRGTPKDCFDAAARLGSGPRRAEADRYCFARSQDAAGNGAKLSPEKLEECAEETKTVWNNFKAGYENTLKEQEPYIKKARQLLEAVTQDQRDLVKFKRKEMLARQLSGKTVSDSRVWGGPPPKSASFEGVNVVVTDSAKGYGNTKVLIFEIGASRLADEKAMVRALAQKTGGWRETFGQNVGMGCPYVDKYAELEELTIPPELLGDSKKKKDDQVPMTAEELKNCQVLTDAIWAEFKPAYDQKAAKYQGHRRALRALLAKLTPEQRQLIAMQRGELVLSKIKGVSVQEGAIKASFAKDKLEIKIQGGDVDVTIPVGGTAEEDEAAMTAALASHTGSWKVAFDEGVGMGCPFVDKLAPSTGERTVASAAAQSSAPAKTVAGAPAVRASAAAAGAATAK